MGSAGLGLFVAEGGEDVARMNTALGGVEAGTGKSLLKTSVWPIHGSWSRPLEIPSPLDLARRLNISKNSLLSCSAV